MKLVFAGVGWMAEPHGDGGGLGAGLLWLLGGGGLFKLWTFFQEWRKGKREDAAREQDQATAQLVLARTAADVEAATKRFIAEHEEAIWKRTQKELDRANARCDRLQEQQDRLETRIEELESALESAHSAIAQKDRELAAATAEVRRLTILTAQQAAALLTIQEDRNSLKAIADDYEKELIRLRGKRSQESGDVLHTGDVVTLTKDGTA